MMTMKRLIISSGLLLTCWAVHAQMVYHLDASKAETMTVEDGKVTAWRDADGKEIAFTYIINTPENMADLEQTGTELIKHLGTEDLQ